MENFDVDSALKEVDNDNSSNTNEKDEVDDNILMKMMQQKKSNLQHQ